METKNGQVCWILVIGSSQVLIEEDKKTYRSKEGMLPLVIMERG